MDLNNLERRFGKYAIPNLTLIMIGIYVLGFILQGVAGNAMGFLTLDPYKIVHHGQVWRLFSWLLTPPYRFSIFTIVNLFFIFSLGRTLERIWGNFRYNLYVLGGVFLMIVGIFLIYGMFSLTGFTARLDGTYGNGAEVFSRALGSCVSTYYIMLSVVLAFSLTVPDMTVMLYFVIPLKMKWLFYIDMAIILLDFFASSLVEKLVIIISLLNFIIFFFSARKKTRVRKRKSPPPGFRVYEGGGHASNSAGHKCVVCGITDRDAPKMMFRYCSKCRGSFEYCEDHLYTHRHVE